MKNKEFEEKTREEMIKEDTELYAKKTTPNRFQSYNDKGEFPSLKGPNEFVRYKGEYFLVPVRFSDDDAMDLCQAIREIKVKKGIERYIP